MSAKTGIEWTDVTWNPVTGCTKVSQGCKHCYAKRDWRRLSANPKSVYFGREFTNVQCHVERLEQPLRWKSSRIFVNSMSGLFHQDFPDEFIDEVFAVMAIAERHKFQVLTKRPGRMLNYLSGAHRVRAVKSFIALQARKITGGKEKFGRELSWPLPNVWIGVSVEDQKTADMRIPLLLDTPATVRWISAEPLLGSIRLDEHGLHGGPGQLDWVVVGGESGPKARPMPPDWARSLGDQCAEACVPFLFKQWGEWAPAEAIAVCDGKKLKETWITQEGHRIDSDAVNFFCGDKILYRAGKKASGHLLDGVLHDEYPR